MHVSAHFFIDKIQLFLQIVDKIGLCGLCCFVICVNFIDQQSFLFVRIAVAILAAQRVKILPVPFDQVRRRR